MAPALSLRPGSRRRIRSDVDEAARPHFILTSAGVAGSKWNDGGHLHSADCQDHRVVQERERLHQQAILNGPDDQPVLLVRQADVRKCLHLQKEYDAKITHTMSSAHRFIVVPIAIVASLAMRVIRYAGVGRLPRTLQVFRKLGIYPIRDHYYEPLLNRAHLRKPLSDDREPPALDWNIGEQLDLPKQFRFNDELVRFRAPSMEISSTSTTTNPSSRATLNSCTT